MGMGVKSNTKMIKTIMPSARRDGSSGVMSSSGCVRTLPSQNKIITHNNQLKFTELTEKVNKEGKTLSATRKAMATGNILRAFSPNKPYAT